MSIPLITLGEVAEIEMGQAPKGDSYNDERIGKPLIAGASDFGKLTPEPSRHTDAPTKISKKGDIILCIRATIGDLNLSDEEYCLGRGVAGLRPKNGKLDERYLWRVLEANAGVLRAKGRGATFLQVSKADIAGLTIPLPPLLEQRRIAAILDQADALRRLRAQALDKLNSLGQAIFHDMFGDVVDYAHTVPSLALLDVVQPDRGISYGIVQRGKHIEEGIPVVRISNLSGDQFDGSNVVRTTPEIDAGYKRTKLKGGELVVSIRGTVGNVAIVPKEAMNWNVSREVAVIPLKEASMGPFFWALLRHHKSQAFVKAEVRGVAQSGINLADLRKLPIPKNYEQLAKEWLPISERLAGFVVDVKLRASQVDKLFGSLQHRAFRGEL